MKMPYEVSWYIKGRVMQTRIYGNVTMDELYAIDKELTALLESSSTVVHSLGDMTGLETHPNSVLELQNSQTYLKHPRMGWLVIYGYESKILNLISTLMKQVFRVRLCVLKSQTEAVAFLREKDTTLPDLNGIKE
jgi:hypothetical protein